MTTEKGEYYSPKQTLRQLHQVYQDEFSPDTKVPKSRKNPGHYPADWLTAVSANMQLYLEKYPYSQSNFRKPIFQEFQETARRLIAQENNSGVKTDFIDLNFENDLLVQFIQPELYCIPEDKAKLLDYNKQSYKN